MALTQEQINGYKSELASLKESPKKGGFLKNFFQDLGGDIKQTGSEIAGSITKRGADFDNEDGLFGKTAALTGALVDTSGALFKGGVKGVLPQGAEDALKSGISKTGELAGQGIDALSNVIPESIQTPIAEATQATIDTVSDLAEKNPEVANALKTLTNVGIVVSDFVGAGQSLTALRGASKAGLKVAGRVGEVVTKGATRLIDEGANATEGAIRQGKDFLSKTSDIVKRQEATGIRSSLDDTVKARVAKDPKFADVVKEAEKQGFGKSEINLLATLADADKPTIKRMFEATVKAQSNPRQVTRAADILGENATGIVKQVATQNSVAGKAVDTAAKSLKGQLVDATTVRQRALSLLEEAGVFPNPDGTLNWSKSVFSKTPALKKRMTDALSDLPAGMTDAFDLHNFKKSLDELVEFGVGGEGLKGRSSGILKQIRKEADDILDTFSPEYNAANVDFKETIEFLEQVKDVVGKKVDFSTKQGTQEFGQAFRSAFSNNKSRGKTLKLIEDLVDMAKKRNLTGAEQNLLDQALYVGILEETFGSAATTGLAGEVKKAIDQAKKGLNVLRNPVTGTLDFAADQLEKLHNITPEAKKEILRRFTD